MEIRRKHILLLQYVCVKRKNHLIYSCRRVCGYQIIKQTLAETRWSHRLTAPLIRSNCCDNRFLRIFLRICIYFWNVFQHKRVVSVILITRFLGRFHSIFCKYEDNSLLCILIYTIIFFDKFEFVKFCSSYF